MPQIQVTEADQVDDGEFNRLNPGNSAPMVAWLASDEALHVTGQVFRAVGDGITHYLPWQLGTEITDRPKGPRQWDPAEIGDAVNALRSSTAAPAACRWAAERAATKRVAIVGAALSDCGRVDVTQPVRAAPPGREPRHRRRRAHQGRRRRLRARAAWACWRRSRSPSTSASGRRGPTAPASAARRGSSCSSTRSAAIQAGHAEVVVLVVRLDDARRPQGAAGARANLAFGTRGPVQFDAPYGHALIAKYAMAARRHMHEYGTTIEQLAEIAVSARYNAGAQPRRLLPRPDHHRRRAVVADDRRPAHEAALLHPLRRRRRGRAHVRGAGPRPAPRRRCGCSAPARRRRTRR